MLCCLVKYEAGSSALSRSPLSYFLMSCNVFKEKLRVTDERSFFYVVHRWGAGGVYRFVSVKGNYDPRLSGYKRAIN